MQSRKSGSAPARFNVGDLVRVKDLPNLFYSRTQMYVRGVCGTIAARTYEEIGIEWAEPTGQGTPSDYMELRVLEDTPMLHHVIVCTLCSCYPRPLLGHSPYWYRSPNYRRRLVRWPRQVLTEFGLVLPPEVEIRVEDSNQKCR